MKNRRLTIPKSTKGDASKPFGEGYLQQPELTRMAEPLRHQAVDYVRNYTSMTSKAALQLHAMELHVEHVTNMILVSSGLMLACTGSLNEDSRSSLSSECQFGRSEAAFQW